MALEPTYLSHLGFQAWVSCDGKRMPVYNVEFQGNKVTCWIASEAGKNFSVHFSQSDGTIRHHIASYVYVDGNFIGGKIFGTMPPYAVAESAVKHIYTTPTTVRKLAFANLATTDNDSAVKDKDILSQLGIISAKMNRCIVEHRNIARASYDTPAHLRGGQLTVHEKAKKLGGHHMALGELETAPVENLVSTRSLDPSGSHYVEFEFKYRPKHVLQAHDIIPNDVQDIAKPSHAARLKRPNAASALDDATNSLQAKKKIKSDINPNDPETLRARIRELEAKLQKPIDIEDEDDFPPLKTEPINAGRFFTKGQVIDLTDA